MNLIFLAALFLTTFTKFTTQFKVLKIGGIFFRGENDLIYAFEKAIDDVNQREFDVRLESVKHYLADDDSAVLQQLTCDLILQNVVAIFGPSSKASSDIVEILCNITGIPHIQFDWHHQETVLHRRNHQMTVNVAPSEYVLSTAYWDILRSKEFDWKSFTIAYESEQSLGRMQYLLANRQLHKNGIKIHRFDRKSDYRILWKHISNSREKYVLLDCTPDILVNVVNSSIFFNMTGSFNHLLLTNLDTHLSDLATLYSKDFNVNVAALRLRAQIPPLLQQEVDIFDEEEEDKIVSLRTMLIYDAVILFLNAARNIVLTSRYYEPELSCFRGRYWKPGREILEEMKTVTPKNGLLPYKTQKLQLNEYGTRDDFNLEIYDPIYNRINFIWNKKSYLIAYDKIGENMTKKSKKPLKLINEDVTPKRVRYTVSTRIGEPYFMWKPELEGEHFEGNERFMGYAVDLIYKLAEECKFDFIFEPVSDNQYGSYDPVTDEWNGIIRQLIDHNAELGICDLTITQARRSVVDFTVPFMQLGVSILHFKTPPPPRNLYAFLNPFALEVWIYLLVALLLMALVLVATSRITPAEWENVSMQSNDVSILENKWYLINSLWLVIGSIMTCGCDMLPRGPPMRVLTACWWIFALLVSQTYIAKLASFITSSKFENPIGNLHDLVEQNKIQFGTVKGGSTSLFFSESNDSDYRLAWNKMIGMKPDAFTSSNGEGVDRVRHSKGRYAFLMETSNLQYYLQRFCDLLQIGEPFGEKLYGIAVPLNAPFRSNLSVGILKLSEKGILYKLKKTWFNNQTITCPDLNDNGQDTTYTLESLGGLFLVLLGGIAFAIFIGICEFLWNVHRISVKEKISTMRALKSELLFFCKFWLHRKPLRTYQRSRDSTSTGYSSIQNSTNSEPTSEKKKKKSRKKKKVAK